jgi:hypothetical protein
MVKMKEQGQLVGSLCLKIWIQNPNQQGDEVILQLVKNYLVIFGIILIPMMLLKRGVTRELVSQVWRISQVNLHN